MPAKGRRPLNNSRQLNWRQRLIEAHHVRMVKTAPRTRRRLVLSASYKATIAAYLPKRGAGYRVAENRAVKQHLRRADFSKAQCSRVRRKSTVKKPLVCTSTKALPAFRSWSFCSVRMIPALQSHSHTIAAQRKRGIRGRAPINRGLTSAAAAAKQVSLPTAVTQRAHFSSSAETAYSSAAHE